MSVLRQRAALTLLLLPTGTEYHLDMNRIRKQCSEAENSDRSERSDVLLREEPDEEEEDEEEDEPNGTGDEDDDAGEDDGGYSVQMYSLCQSDR